MDGQSFLISLPLELTTVLTWTALSFIINFVPNAVPVVVQFRARHVAGRAVVILFCGFILRIHG